MSSAFAPTMVYRATPPRGKKAVEPAAAPAKPARAARGRAAPAPKAAAPKAAPSTRKSKQRPFRLGGKTPGPELYEDGLTQLERDLIAKGESNALTGAAKLRFFIQNRGKK